MRKMASWITGLTFGGTLKALARAAVYLLIYVIPVVILFFVVQSDPDVRSMLDLAKAYAAIDVMSIATTVALLGFIAFLLALISGLTGKWRAVNLASEGITVFVELAIHLTIVGLGDIGSMGYVSRTIAVPGEFHPAIVVDVRAIAWAWVIIAFFKLALAFAEYFEARRERQRSGVDQVAHQLGLS